MVAAAQQQLTLIPKPRHPLAVDPLTFKECVFCSETQRLYRMAGKWICLDHIAFTVSLAANDIWPGAVSYTREFEDFLIW